MSSDDKLEGFACLRCPFFPTLSDTTCFFNPEADVGLGVVLDLVTPMSTPPCPLLCSTSQQSRQAGLPWPPLQLTACGFGQRKTLARDWKVARTSSQHLPSISDTASISFLPPVHSRETQHSSSLLSDPVPELELNPLSPLPSSLGVLGASHYTNLWWPHCFLLGILALL